MTAPRGSESLHGPVTETESGLRSLGRVFVPDPRDQDYLAADVLSPRMIQTDVGVRGKLTSIGRTAVSAPDARAVEKAGIRLRKRPWTIGPTLDQDGIPSCVLYAWTNWAISAPIMQEHPAVIATRKAGRIVGVDHGTVRAVTNAGYSWAQANDEWPGTQYDGTSVRAGAKWMVTQGLLAEYRWVWDVETAIAYLRSEEGGPLVGGFDWFSGMSRPDSKGYVEPTGRWEGGHAFLVYWYSERTDAFSCFNQWGPQYGVGNDGGIFYIRRPAMQYLLEALSGELCAGRQVKLTTTRK